MRPPLYGTWGSMMQRCYNERRDSYPNYGGRGIKVCARWHDYRNFETDMSPRPARATLERIDNDADYSPENCRWASRQEQALNRRSNIVLTHNGVSKRVSEWADALGVSRYLLYKRLRRGWDTKQCFSDLMPK